MDEDKLLEQIRILTRNDDLPFPDLMDKIIQKCEDLKEQYLFAAEKHHLYNVCEYVLEQGISSCILYQYQQDLKIHGQLQISRKGISDTNRIISRYDDIVYMQNGNSGLLVDIEKRIVYKIPKLSLIDKFQNKLGIVSSLKLIGEKRKLLLIGEHSNKMSGPIIYLIANPDHVIMGNNHVLVKGPVSTHLYIKDLSSLKQEVQDWLQL